jgi:hypothetical protein
VWVELTGDGILRLFIAIPSFFVEVPMPEAPKKFEYAFTGGPGTLLVLGVTDNPQTAIAHVTKEILRSAAGGVTYEKVDPIGPKEVPDDTPVGTR